MAIEMLAIKIRSNNIRVLEIKGLKIKVYMYADESSFILIPQDRSLQCLIEDLDNFSVLSWLKPNYDKCTILRIVSLKIYTLPCSLPIKWADGEVDMLGIHITKDINKLSTMNFNRKHKNRQAPEITER